MHWHHDNNHQHNHISCFRFLLCVSLTDNKRNVTPSGGCLASPRPARVVSCRFSCRVTSCRVSSCVEWGCRGCRVVPCRVVSFRFVPRVSCRVTLPSRVISCHVVLCRFVSCLPCRVVSCRIVSFLAMSCRVVVSFLACHVVLCRVVSCRTVSCHVVSFLAMACHIVSCRALRRCLYHGTCRDVATFDANQVSCEHNKGVWCACDAPTPSTWGCVYGREKNRTQPFAHDYPQISTPLPPSPPPPRTTTATPTASGVPPDGR